MNTLFEIMHIKDVLWAKRHREWWFYYSISIIFFIGTLFFFAKKDWTFLYWLVFVGYYFCTYSALLMANNIFVLHHSKQGNELGFSIALFLVGIIVAVWGIVLDETKHYYVWPFFIISFLLTYFTIHIFSHNDLNTIPFAKDEYNSRKDYVKTQSILDKNMDKKSNTERGEV